MNLIEQTILSNGVRVVTERMENVRSVALGVWVNAGSVFETGSELGVSHFIEHMLFKGTQTRSASDIAAEMDALGGNLNAFTAKECTCFHVKVLDEDLKTAVDVLSDILTHSTFDPEELAKERSVVLEELAMTEDSPEDVAFDRACAGLYRGTPLESEILGTNETVGAMQREDLLNYLNRHYTTQNIVISAAGSFEREALLSMLEERFCDLGQGERIGTPAIEPQNGLFTTCVKKDVEQVHLCLVIPGAPLGTAAYETLAVLSNALGGSMSSRMFQHIREERGLAYSVYSYPMSYRGTGCLCLYAGCTEGQAKEVLSLMLKEIDELKRNGLSMEEFVRAKQQLKGGYLLGMESTMAHMSAIGKTALLLDEEYQIETILNRIECVTIDAVQTAARDRFSPKALSCCAVGRSEALLKSLQDDVRAWWDRNGQAG